MGTSSEVTRDGMRGMAPDREARIGENAGPGPSGPSRSKRAMGDAVVPRPEFQSYYGLPVLNKPTWEPLDIAGYLFLGGLAGTSSTLAAAAALTGRERLARPLRYGAAGAISLSFVALVHDLGRPGRFYNMLRVFRPSSPMSVGSWILSAYGPCALGAAALSAVGSSLPAPLRRVVAVVGPAGRALTMGAGVLGPAVATYTAVLVSDTAVPAWHGGYREMPFLFAGSAASAGAGLGLMAAPVSEAAPARRLGVAGAVAEVALGRIMRRRMGLPAEAYESGRAGRLMRAAEVLAVGGAALAVAGRRSRLASAAAGACMVAGSALTRFGIFHAGVQSAEDPRYTVEPQKERAGRKTSGVST